MKRSVSITFEIDPTEYNEKDTREAAIRCVIACLFDEADWPQFMMVNCEGQEIGVNTNDVEEDT